MHFLISNPSDASNELNQSRLKVLKARDDVLQKLLVESQQQLAKIGQSPQYPQILEKLILQVCYGCGEEREWWTTSTRQSP